MRSILAVLIAVALLLAGCGGGTSSVIGSGSGGSGSGGTGTSDDVWPVIVDQGPAALQAAGEVAVNILYTTVTICQPGSTTNCQTIDHVQVDTGSSGLRILSSVLNSSLDLPAQTLNGAGLAECTQFVDGNSWGAVATADLYIGGAGGAGNGEVAAGIPVQVIGASTYAEPGDCSSAGDGMDENTVPTFGANGLIGLAPFEQDCGAYCAQTSANGYYYTCSSATSCQPAEVPQSAQLINPVIQFATDNNGVIIQLPAVPEGGAATVTGSLIFGIGTESNNALASTATVLTVDPDSGFISTTFQGENLTQSYLDSGSNGLFFDDPNIPTCSSSGPAPDFFCPASTTAFTAQMLGYGGSSTNLAFTLENAENLFTDQSTYAAFSTLGGAADSETDPSDFTTFDWGVPFFYGRSVYTAIELHDTPGGDGPYYAY